MIPRPSARYSLLACALWGVLASPDLRAQDEPTPLPAKKDEEKPAAPGVPVIRRADGSVIEYDASQEDIFIDFCLIQNNKCLSNVTARYRGDELQVELPAEKLAALGVDGAALEGLRVADQPDWYLLKGAEFDPFSLSAKWAIPVTALNAQNLNGESREAVKTYEGRTPMTVALNYSVSYGDSAVGSGDLAIGRKNTAFLTSGTWSQANGEYVRGLTRLEHDIPSRKQRWILGEQTAGSGEPLGAGNLITGVGVVRSFEMDPTLVTSSRPTISGVLEGSGTLEVYSNGILLLSRPVQPGPFSLEQLGIPNGRQNIELVLLDANGNRRPVTQGTLYGSTRVLAKGLSEYGLQTGNVERSAFDVNPGDVTQWPLDPEGIPIPPVQLRPSLDNRVTQAYYRRGVTDWLTLGARADVGDRTQSYGVSAGVTGRWGDLGVSYGSSSQGGSAWDADYSLVGRRWSLGVGYQRLDPDYVLPGQSLASPEGRVLQVASLRGSVQITQGIGLTYQAFDSRFENGVRERNQSINLSGQAWGGSRWTLSGFESKRTDGRPVDRSVGLFVSMPLGRRQNVSASVQQENGALASSAAWNLSRDGEFGPSGSLQTSRSEQGGQVSSGRADYQTPYGLYQVTADQSNGQRTVLGTVSGGVVVGAGRMIFTQPLSGGLALLRSPQTPGIEGVRENSPVGKTDRRGDLFIRGLTPYYPSVIGLDTDALPINISPGDVPSKNFLPTAHTLTVLEFNAAPVVSVQGVIRWVDGKPVRYGALTVTNKGVEEEISLGAEGLFYAENLTPGDYEGRLSTTEGSGICRFTVPEGQEAFLDLGNIDCKKNEGVAP